MTNYSFTYTPPEYARGANLEATGSVLHGRGLPDRNDLQFFKTSDPNVIRFELYLRNFTDGIDLMAVAISPGNVPAKLASTTLDGRWRNTLTLLPRVIRTTI